MALNPDKTKCMIITTRQKRQNLQVNFPPIYIGNKAVEEVDCQKLLGVVIDNNLSWSNHVASLCKTVSRKVFQLTKIKNFLNYHSKKVFFHAHIQSVIDYASTLWDSASANILKPLVSLHKRSIKIILNRNSSLTISDYKTLNILPLKLKLTYNKGIMMHRIMMGYAPTNLSTRFPINYARHSKSISTPLPRIDLFKTSLTYSGGMLWNTLPTFLKEKTSHESFKEKYFLYLIQTIK